MRIVAQVVKEFSNEYPIYAGSTNSNPSTNVSNLNLFKPNNPFPNTGINNNPGMFGQQGFNPQNGTTMISSNIGNFKPNINVGGGMNMDGKNQGGMMMDGNQKNQVLPPLKARCKEYLFENKIEFNQYR
ncbi:MAG: hypothetical protein EOO43_20975 [Flavobacterium sp.]|nr:MAG: hypothetical protein EOO43_20975 [Flavobacterium sp.]